MEGWPVLTPSCAAFRSLEPALLQLLLPLAALLVFLAERRRNVFQFEFLGRRRPREDSPQSRLRLALKFMPIGCDLGGPRRCAAGGGGERGGGEAAGPFPLAPHIPWPPPAFPARGATRVQGAPVDPRGWGEPPAAGTCGPGALSALRSHPSPPYRCSAVGTCGMGESRVAAVMPTWHPPAPGLPLRGDPALARLGLLAKILPSACTQEGEAVLAQQDPDPLAIPRWPRMGRLGRTRASPSPAWWVLEGAQRGDHTVQGGGVQGWGVVRRRGCCRCAPHVWWYAAHACARCVPTCAPCVFM